jgi:hypothetical protein
MKIRSIFTGDFFFPNLDSNIDPNDDSIDRWLVWHYRYDPERRERRNIVIACFDNRRAFTRFLERSKADLNEAQLAGRADKEERITGVMWKEGYREEIAQRRLFRRGPGQIK